MNRRRARFGLLINQQSGGHGVSPFDLSTKPGEAHLVLSDYTVKTHLRRIYEKLGVDNRHDAMVREDPAHTAAKGMSWA